MSINSYLQAVRRHIDWLKRYGRKGQYICWQIMPEEIHDPTLVSYRAYGTRDHSQIIQLACGTNSAWEPLPETEIILPLMKDLTLLLRQHEPM